MPIANTVNQQLEIMLNFSEVAVVLIRFQNHSYVEHPIPYQLFYVFFCFFFFLTGGLTIGSNITSTTGLKVRKSYTGELGDSNSAHSMPSSQNTIARTGDQCIHCLVSRYATRS